MKVVILKTLLWVVNLSLTASDESSIEFPAILSSEDIAYFSSNYDLDGLHWALSNVFSRSSRNPNAASILNDLPPSLISRGGGSTYTSAYKLKCDLEQARYLSKELEDEEVASFFGDTVASIYEKVLDNIPPLKELEEGNTGGLYAFVKEDYDLGISSLYNKALHHTNFEELKDDEGNVLSLLNDRLDAEKIQRQWFGEDLDHGHPGVVVIDDLLSPLALIRIRQLLLESTVFYQTKMPHKFGGYVGAYLDDGLHDRILIALAFHLHKALPRIMKNHPLKYLWAYKYDSEYTGINTHADQAAVNVNIWLTPDQANLNHTNGGLVVFTAKPPTHWDFHQYNTHTDRIMEQIIKPTNYANVTIPHKLNRAVIFDSALFHHTDNFHFKNGYQNRRINLTILYGDMQQGKENTEQQSDEL